jgi:hypothetical protein
MLKLVSGSVWLNNYVVFSPDEIRQNDRGGTESTRLKAVSRSPGHNGSPPTTAARSVARESSSTFQGNVEACRIEGSLPWHNQACSTSGSGSGSGCYNGESSPNLGSDL